jgi:hypothetical protein
MGDGFEHEVFGCHKQILIESKKGSLMVKGEKTFLPEPQKKRQFLRAAHPQMILICGDSELVALQVAL